MVVKDFLHGRLMCPILTLATIAREDPDRRYITCAEECCALFEPYTATCAFYTPAYLAGRKVEAQERWVEEKP